MLYELNPYGTEACSNIAARNATIFIQHCIFRMGIYLLITDKRGESDILSLEMRGQELLLLARVREKSGNVRGALATLKEAKENQHRYIQRLAVSPDVTDQKHVLANICLTMADYATTLRNYDEAIVYFKEALSYKPTDVNALLSLAKLYMQVNIPDGVYVFRFGNCNF